MRNAINDQTQSQRRQTETKTMVNTKGNPVECVGRQMDEQIQTVRERIELGDVERLMRNHESVKDAAVVVLGDGPDAKVVGFVTLYESAGESVGQSGDESESKQVQLWETVFDKGIYTAFNNGSTTTTDNNNNKMQSEKAIGRDFTGWVSAYNGIPLDIGEMNAWLDDTVDTILGCDGGGQSSLNFLELGTGSGMILFNATKNLSSYHGLEPSRAAIDFVTATAKSIPELENKVHMYQGTATELHLLESASPDVVVINSVAQYFPSQSYLLKVVEGILRLDSVRTIFFGDIRSYALVEEFLVSKTICRSGGKASKDEVREAMIESQAQSELLIDPAFFTSLPGRFPSLIEHVEILPKRMKADNELSAYRYAAVIHARSQEQVGGQLQQRPDIHEIRDDDWINFTDRKLDHKSLLRRLVISAPPLLAVSNIPYSKTILERHVLDSLNNDDDDAGLEGKHSEWLSSIRQRSQTCPSLSALDLVSLAQQAGYRVEISWARQHSQRGALDAIFHRIHHQPSSNGSSSSSRDITGDSSRVMFRFPTDHQGRSPDTFCNQPLLQQQPQKRPIQQQIRDTLLQAQLPLHVIPEEIVVLEKLPTGANGEVNHHVLVKNGGKDVSV